jgi:hypothetical protein
VHLLSVAPSATTTALTALLLLYQLDKVCIHQKSWIYEWNIRATLADTIKGCRWNLHVNISGRNWHRSDGPRPVNLVLDRYISQCHDYWLLVPWRFYAWHPHHTSRDRSRFLRMLLFINSRTFKPLTQWLVGSVCVSLDDQSLCQGFKCTWIDKEVVIHIHWPPTTVSRF